MTTLPVTDQTCLAATGANPVDTDDNASDFLFVDTNGTSAGAGQRLGAPGPENLSSPVQGIAAVTSADVVRIDTAVTAGAPPNWVRDLTSVPASNSTFGTLDFRLTYTNQTGANLNPPSLSDRRPEHVPVSERLCRPETNGTVVLGTNPLAGGQATLTVVSLTAGTHSITAAYGGDGTTSPASRPY